ncbi:MAG: DUF5658 family protein [bacterium]
MYKNDNRFNKGEYDYGFISFILVFMLAMLQSGSLHSQEIAESIAMASDSCFKSTALKTETNKRRLDRRDWFYTGLEINYALLNTLDLITTFNSLESGAREANPVARLYIKNKPLAIIIKGSITAGTLYGLAHVKQENKKAAYITLGLLNVIYGFVVRNNIGVYLQLRQ